MKWFLFRFKDRLTFSLERDDSMAVAAARKLGADCWDVEQLIRLEAENKKLRECLEFYADRKSWRYPGEQRFNALITADDCGPVLMDKANRNEKIGGKRARSCLKEIQDGQK